MFDAIVLRALIAELSPCLISAKIDKVQQPASDLLVLSVRTPLGNRRLIINTGAHAPRIQLTSSAFENPAQPPMFCMLLRKYLTNARIAFLSQPGGDRVVRFELVCTDELGDSARRALVVELMGRYSNVILIDADGIIIDCLRRVDAEMSPVRQLLPGLLYRAPALGGKLSLEDSAPDAVAQILTDAQTPRDKLLFNHFAWLSPLVSRELVYRAGTDAQPLGTLVNTLREEILAHRYTPTLLRERRVDPNGRENEVGVDFCYMPITQYGSLRTSEVYGSFSELLDAFYIAREEEEHRIQRTQSVKKVVTGAREKLVKKLAVQRQELISAERREKYKRQGDLITANIWKLKQGQARATVTDYENDCEVEIALDVQLTPQANAQKAYKQYARQKRAEEMLSKMIADGERELEYLDSVLDALSRCDSQNELAAIRRELADNGYASQKWAAGGKKVRDKPVPPLHLTAPNGFDVWIGRNNTQNEQLTLKTAAKSDWWFHVQKSAGAHVILSCEGRMPDDETLTFCAVQAARHSSVSGAGLVPVDYTQIRHVKKQPDGKTGMVIYTNYKTAYVNANE